MDRHKDAAELLLSARRDPTQPLLALPRAVAPKTEGQAQLIQREVMAALGPIGGWKVGSPSPDGPCHCSPMPRSGIKPSPAQVDDAPARLVEAEVAVLIGRDLPTREIPYSRDEVLAAIESAHPAIEILQPRFADPDAQDALSGLADSLGHGGFVHGPAVPGWHGVDLLAESVTLLADGAAVKRRQGNPAGDMIRLVIWLANDGSTWAGGLKAGQWVTTGSWTGKDQVAANVPIEARFDRMGSAMARFSR